MKKFLFNKWPRSVWTVFFLLVPAIIIYSYFPKVFECPSCYLYENTGDGLKNYYTLSYYVQHDQGWHFSGMNYPYGEHIIYTDNQPILAFLLRWIDRNVINMDRHVVGTLNILLLVSLYLAVIVTYLLLRRWGIGRWWSLGSALCIIFLSPQLMRFHGHYGLAYAVYLPLLILLVDLLVRDSKKRWLWSTLSCTLIVIMSLSHMYFLLISLVMTISFFIFWWWYHRKENLFLRSVWPWLTAAIVVPALFLIGLRSITDDVKDRPVEPWGIDAHLVTFETTFFPFLPPLDKAWVTILGKKHKPNNEKLAYTGMIGLLMLPAFLFFLFSKRDNDFLNLHVKGFLGAAIISWLMAAGVFYQNGFKFIWEILPVLKQFRGLGRFGMAFYYLYMLVCSYLLWHVYIKMREKGLAKTGAYLMGAVFLVWGFEAWLNLKAISAPVLHENKWMSNAKDDYVPLLTSAGYKPEDFQAILQFPLLAIGNETFGVARGFWTMREGIHASMETGLPMIDYAMSRTSVSQGMDIIELISTPYSPKRRGMLLNEKPILLLCEEEFIIAAERKWIDQAQKIGTYQSITLYRLPSDVFKKTQLPVLPDSLHQQKCEGWFNGFEEYKCDTSMTGDGALIITKEAQSIWTYTDMSIAERDWLVSFWSHIDNMKGHVPVPRMMETDPHGSVKQNTGLHRESILWSEVYGEWIQVSFPWKTLGKGYKYELFIDQTGPVIDNLLIRQEGDTCIIRTPEMVLYNNIPIPLTK